MAKGKFERKPGTGVLFKNKNKKTDRHPDYQGTFYSEDGQDYWLSAWINEAKGTGEKYMSLNLGGIKEQQSSGQADKPLINNFADFDDDVPF